MVQATENCVADMLHIDKVVIVEQKPQCCCQDCSNLQSLMKLLKHFSIDRREKVKLLALLPNSWTTEKTMNYFSVSKRCISSARKLKKSSGIPSIIQKKTGRTFEWWNKTKYSFNMQCDNSPKRAQTKRSMYLEIDGKHEHVTETLFIAKSERTSYRIFEYLFQNTMKKLLNSLNYMSCYQNGISL